MKRKIKYCNLSREKVMKIFKESQKKVDNNKMISYPIASIQKISDTEMKIVCRDEYSVQVIKNAMAMMQRYRAAEHLPALEYGCTFSEDPLVLDFVIFGDLAFAVSDFAEIKFTSDKLKEEVTASLLTSNLSCK